MRIRVRTRLTRSPACATASTGARWVGWTTCMATGICSAPACRSRSSKVRNSDPCVLPMSMSRHLSPGLAMVFAALTGGCAERFFFYPDQHVYTTPQAEGLLAEEVLVPGPDGIQLHGWWLPAQGDIHGTVLHVHGNAANISNHLPLVAWLPAAGFNVLTFDYRGYGRSSGKPTIQGLVDDTRAALAWLRSRPGV